MILKNIISWITKSEDLISSNLRLSYCSQLVTIFKIDHRSIWTSNDQLIAKVVDTQFSMPPFLFPLRHKVPLQNRSICHICQVAVPFDWVVAAWLLEYIDHSERLIWLHLPLWSEPAAFPVWRGHKQVQSAFVLQLFLAGWPSESTATFNVIYNVSFLVWTCQIAFNDNRRQ